MARRPTRTGARHRRRGHPTCGRGDHALLARLLAGRGFTTAGGAMASSTRRPARGHRSVRGARRQGGRRPAEAGAVDRRERVLVWGDFDADGQTATAVVVLALRRLGLDPGWHVPVRARGVARSERRRASARSRSAGASLVVTCDCGVPTTPDAAPARDAGVDTIVTDHHAGLAAPTTGRLAEPAADPAAARARPPGQCHLSGVGVAYYLATGLLIAFGRHANECSTWSRSGRSPTSRRSSARTAAWLGPGCPT